MTSVAPILILAFNRPDTTRRVLESLRPARPQRIFFAVDGPRLHIADESQRVAQVRDLVSVIDWGCDVKTLFRDQNLGCKLGVSGAISWFFEHVESGIILEDDCLAHPSFFPYACELLERYRDEDRVMMISGDNFQKGRRKSPYSYYYSRYAHIWGWATWRRAWQHYDHEMKSWPALRDSGWLTDLLGDRHAARYWTNIFDDTHQNRNTSWAYRWQFCVWARNGLAILPRSNLVSNIGFGELATHTTEAGNPWANMSVQPMTIPMNHPSAVIRDDKADRYTQETVFSSSSVWRQLIAGCRSVARKAVGARAI